MSSLQQIIKDVMANVATPVAVVTTMANGLPAGTTVSAFISLSVSPPMVLVSLDKGSNTLEFITESQMFGLNILARDQHGIAVKFAAKNGVGKFDGVGWNVDHGLPRIAGAVGWVACRVDRFHEGGDHVIALGDVVAADWRHADPLTYHRRAFGTHLAFEAVGP